MCRRNSLSAEQQAAADQTAEFMRSDRQAFVLHGLAGTGKTALLAHLAQRCPDALLCAPTGKAAFTLRQRTGRDASTIHAAFHEFIGRSRRRDREVLDFAPRFEQGELRGRLVLLDEASMVCQKLAREMLASGARIIAAGDPGQLAPVEGIPFFTCPDTLLTQVHRQAWGSGIIRQAHAVLSGQPYQPDGEEFQVADEPPDADFGVALCYRNATRRALNAEIRESLGYGGRWPLAGELVVCLRNNSTVGVYNGAVYETLADFDPARGRIELDVEGREVSIPHCRFQGDDRPADFDFGYALTVHKAQGSEWDAVLLVDEYPRGDPVGRRRWLYTAITRAASRIVVVRPAA